MYAHLHAMHSTRMPGVSPESKRPSNTNAQRLVSSGEDSARASEAEGAAKGARVTTDEPTVSLPVSQLSTRQLLRHLVGQVEVLKSHIRTQEASMTDLTQMVDDLIVDVRRELDQVTQALRQQVDSLSAENSDLAGQLQALTDQTQAAAERISSLSTELRANDPQEPAPTPRRAGPNAR